MKKWIYRAASLLLLTALVLPGQTAKAAEAANNETKPAFQNPQGMSVDLAYYTLAADGSENIVKKAERTVIPAGIAAVTVQLQEQFLPQGYHLKEAKDIALEEDTREVKIPVVAVSGNPQQPDSSEPTEKPTEPADPTEKPTEPADPTEKPTEPADPTEKPTEPADPTEKPTEPAEKPTEKPTEPTVKPTEKPTEPTVKPTEKPQKPQKPTGKPDPTNPQTGDSFPMGLWLSLGIGSAASLLLLYRKKLS